MSRPPEPMRAASSRAGLIGLALLVASCQVPGAVGYGITEAEALLLACGGYQRTLTALASYAAAGDLSDDQITAVNRNRPLLNAACVRDTPPANAGAMLDDVQRAMVELLRIERQAEGY